MSIRDSLRSVFIELVFTKAGNALLGCMGGAFMAIMTFLTKALDLYEPAIFGVAVLLGFIVTVAGVRLLLSIYVLLSTGIKTTEKTLVEYKMENNSLVLTRKQNIYKEPFVVLNHQIIPLPSSQPQSLEPTRNERRAQRRGSGQAQAQPQALQPQPQMLQHSVASLIINFEKPLSNIHLQIEQIVGRMPVRGNHSIDERWAIVELGGLMPDSAFRICFN